MIVNGKIASKFVRKPVKVNPNGIDLAPEKVFMIPADITAYLYVNKRGYIIDDGSFKEAYDIKKELKYSKDGFYNIPKNSIIEIVLPAVNIPKDMMAIIYPRSTFNRLGIIKSQSGVLDAGYKGTPTQTFFFPISARIHKDEAWVQIVFYYIKEPTGDTYKGYYQEKEL
ncbi:MAG: dCTP deaminase domain-containing protein [Candidatus Asgardarchaeia archaeon]